MYLIPSLLTELEHHYGRPMLATAQAEFLSREFALLEYCRRKERAHDLTLLIEGRAEREGQFALIRKPSYPPGVFRPPSGGVEPGEAIEEGAAREAREETGLEVQLERYLLRVEARFTCAGAMAPWTSHVFLARATGGTLLPQDRKEIEEACWATLEEIGSRYRPAMLRMGTAGMRYRVDLQDWAFWAAGLSPEPLPEPGRVLIAAPAPGGRPEG